jgi:hypothetical protein
MRSAGAAIAGIYEFPGRRAGGLSRLQIKAECARQALADAGLCWSDVEPSTTAARPGRCRG